MYTCTLVHAYVSQNEVHVHVHVYTCTCRSTLASTVYKLGKGRVPITVLCSTMCMWYTIRVLIIYKY